MARLRPTQTPVLLAIGAAVLYGLGSPVSKLLLESLPPILMASLLYLGAGAGMLALRGANRALGRTSKEAPVTRKETPWVVAMILLDIAAPILLMAGLARSQAAAASLLNNFEIVATSLVALLVFREQVGARLWAAIGFITCASIRLSVPSLESLEFSPGALLVLLACVLWGVENNCTRKLSSKDPLMIVVIKGLGSGSGAALAALGTGTLPDFTPALIAPALAALGLGFVSYGLSIYLYVAAQRELGAARTSAYYALAPFAGAAFAFLIFGDPLTLRFLSALALMAAGGYLAATGEHGHIHLHPAETHNHRHDHADGHHDHDHSAGGPPEGSHSHEHTHETLEHAHGHLPDAHHRHVHVRNQRK